MVVVPGPNYRQWLGKRRGAGLKVEGVSDDQHAESFKIFLWVFDTASKTVVYCEASLITELLKALGEAGEEDAPVAASIGQKVSD
ncbi:hypothetical protein [Hydrogenophaga pseudoflava]|uniref:hypothetical protein n=1 Tax=Hydrogenophaga pseudoflava TaxID=47421 RepID=UPI0027E48BA1|nr:hypothetical protein [Hydrogenophaga pseudoflava]MDQ7743783.1 hypothetical protein [Hydrogenophaga pseudoflava]